MITRKLIGEDMENSEWLKVLHLVADDIYAAIQDERHRGECLENREYKQILDKAAQCALIESLQTQQVAVQLISEEGNAIICGGGPVLIADPVDGTTNLARGLSPAVACLSISDSCMFSGTIAAVIKNLYTGVTYSASRRGGATFDNRLIKVATPRHARSALISVDISKEPKLNRITPLLLNCRYLRMLGSSATELSLVASGTLDAHIDIRGTVRATDVAAALHILNEAGGTYAVDRSIGADFTLTRETKMELVAASSLPLLDELLTLTKPPA